MSEWIKIGNEMVNLDMVAYVGWMDGWLFLQSAEQAERGRDETENCIALYDGPEAESLWYYLTEGRQGTYAIPVTDDE